MMGGEWREWREGGERERERKEERNACERKRLRNTYLQGPQIRCTIEVHLEHCSEERIQQSAQHLGKEEEKVGKGREKREGNK